MTEKSIEQISLEILRSALDAKSSEDSYFDLHCDETDLEMKRVYWNRCEEYAGMCRAYLDAYAIISGVKVHGLWIDIKNEIDKICCELDEPEE